MGGFNPCGCWNLKDGCITIGIWSLLFCIIQFGLFGWQTSAVADQKAIASNNYYGYQNRPYPGDFERYYEQSFYANRDSRFWTGLFVVQILVLIVTFFLLFATVALIYGIHTDSKYLVWPWFPCQIGNVLCCVAYCILWWAGDIQSYWMALTIVQMVGVMVNIYALVCVMTYYGRIGNDGSDDPKNDKRRVQYAPDTQFENIEFDQYGQPTVVSYNKASGQSNVMPVNKQYAQQYDPYQQQQQQYQPQYDPYQQQYEPAAVAAPAPAAVTNGGPQFNYAYEAQPAERPVYIAGQPPGVAAQQPQQQPLQQQQPYYPQAEALPPKQPIGWEQQQQQQQPPYQPQQPQQPQQPADYTSSWVAQQDLPPIHGDPQQYIQQNTAPAVTPDTVPLVAAAGGKHKDARSEPDYERDDERQRRRNRNGRTRSGSVRSRRSRRHRYDSDDSDEEERSRRRHRSSQRHGDSHSRSRSRDYKADPSDSETVYTDKSCRHRKHHRDRDRDDDKAHGRSMKDVKRRQEKRPETATTDRSTTTTNPKAAAGRPNANGGPITIPQKIVIPPSKGNPGKEPARYHINSEITISYSDRSTNASGDELGRAAKGKGPRAAALGTGSAGQPSSANVSGSGLGPPAGPPGPTVQSPSDPPRPYSYGQDSVDSKGNTCV